jgi:DNA mismatch repair protein MutS
MRGRRVGVGPNREASFASVLFDDPHDRPSTDRPPGDGSTGDERDVAAYPAYFADLHLDQVVASLTRGRGEYRLEPLFTIPLRRVESVGYRHEVFRDLQDEPLRERVQDFAKQMRSMRSRLAQTGKLHYARQRQRWFLDAADTYGQAVTRLAEDLDQANPSSRGLLGLRDYLAGYRASADFTTLLTDTASVAADLAGVRYAMTIRGDRVRVIRYADEPDYSGEVLATFEKFAQGAVKDYRVNLANWVDMNHVEAAVLDLVARLYPEVFAGLDDFCRHHAGYLDPVVADIDRELQFYLAYLEYIESLAGAGLSFCFPQVSATSKQVYARDTFDLALADKLAGVRPADSQPTGTQTAGRRPGSRPPGGKPPGGKSDGDRPVRQEPVGSQPVVCNDFALHEPERVIVVTGPNQGGKTTFARTFGQLHHLARLGLPVPGRAARLFLCDQVFTHFEKEEDATTLRGKLEDDLIRIRDILTRATGDSVVILNEIFTSTALADALLLGEQVLTEIIAKDLLCVCVTFVDEWASLGPTTLSMVSTVTPQDPAVRTFKILRRAADGRSYADSIADKHGLSYQRLHERISQRIRERTGS